MDATPLDRRLLIVSGKGGVGKSAVVASLAHVASRRGMRALALAMTDPIGLATHLGAEELTPKAHELLPGVEAAFVDRSHALDEYLRIQMRVPRAAPTRQLSRMLQVLVDTAPGVREIISMGKPIYETWRGDYDIVIVDAPATGQLGSYLRAPATIASIVPSGGVRDQAERMRATLSDAAACGVLLITTPDELPVVETREMVASIEAEQLVAIAGVVFNRTLPDLGMSRSRIAALPPGPHRSAAQLHAGLYESQQKLLPELDSSGHLPFLFGLMTPPEVAARLAEEWT
ncbi:MAG TPA: ArsA-related P-loop ATPase [Acidimicrobiia bacterium]|jgi:anion-transporting  ArsA/GET3 family ATPase